MIRVVITDMPPSANAMRAHFVQGGKVRSVKSKNYAAWKKAAAWEIASARPGKIEERPVRKLVMYAGAE